MESLADEGSISVMTERGWLGRMILKAELN